MPGRLLRALWDDHAAYSASAQAYRRRMRVLHPDTGGDQAEAQLANLAWYLLRTDRDGYDRYRAGTGDGLFAGDRPFTQAEDPWAGAESWEPAPDEDVRGSRPGAAGRGVAAEEDAQARRQWEEFERDLRRSRQPRQRPPARQESRVVSLPLVLLLMFVLVTGAAVVGAITSTGGTTDTPTRYYPAVPSTYPTVPPYPPLDPYRTDLGNYLTFTPDPYRSLLASMLATMTADPRLISPSTRRR